MRIITDKFEVFKRVVLDWLIFVKVDVQNRERSWISLNLFQKWIDMILVDVGVSHHVDEVSRLEISHLSNEASHESIACDVEWNS